MSEFTDFLPVILLLRSYNHYFYDSIALVDRNTTLQGVLQLNSATLAIALIGLMLRCILVKKMIQFIEIQKKASNILLFKIRL